MRLPSACPVLPLRAGAAGWAAALLGGSAAARGSLSLLPGSVDGITAGRGHGQRGSLGSFCGAHGDKMDKKGRVLLSPLWDPGERPDSSSEDVGRAGSTPILDPEPRDDLMQSFGKETRPKTFFCFNKFSWMLEKPVNCDSGKRAPQPLRTSVG